MVPEVGVSLALELQSYLNLHGQQLGTSVGSVDNLVGPSRSQIEFFCVENFNIKDEYNCTVDSRSDETVLMTVVPVAGRNIRSPTTARIKASAAIGTKPREML